jgi:hypothetical protein
MNRKTQLGTNFLYVLSGVSPALIIRIINDTEFLQELSELIQKYASSLRKK